MLPVFRDGLAAPHCSSQVAVANNDTTKPVHGDTAYTGKNIGLLKQPDLRQVRPWHQGLRPLTIAAQLRGLQT